jgi:hypothetical protein
MSKKEIKLMFHLAKKLKEEKRNTQEILTSFVSAGILTSTGNYTKNYSELKNIEKASKAD